VDLTEYDIRQLNLMLLDRRIVDKCVLDKECAAITELLVPFQLGTGIAGGAEAILHTTNKLRDTIDRKTRAEVDFNLQNAYGCCLPQITIDSIVDKLPDMAWFVAAVYSQAGRLYYEDHVFSLTSDVDQGDPLAGLLFLLTLHAFLLKVHNVIPDLQLNAWYLDDGKIVSTFNDTSRAVQMFVDDGPEHSLHLQLHKSSITSDADAIVLRCLFPTSINFKTYEDGQKTFECPIDPNLYVHDFIKAKINNIQSILDRIMYINNPQIEMIILRDNANSSKINHLLRTMRQDHIHDKL
jgi:hypothetical protein